MGDNNKDLEDLARSTTEDYYELLGVPFDAEESTIKRAYRKASIRYHPDKNPDSKDAADKFINLGLARDILIDAKLKGEYDRARTRRREKAFQDELLTGNRRKMKEELERRERESANFGASLKRKRAENMSEAEKREQEIQRLAEDGRRRRKEMQERREKARKEDEAAAAATAEPVKSQEPQAPKPGQSADIDRTIKVRFHRDSETAAWDRDTIRSLFSKYGNIDSVIITGKDKKLKLEGQKLRKLVATVFIVYKRLDHAHAAVSDAKEDFPALESVAWVNGEPDLTSTAAHANGIAPKTASLEEITMMRLKEAGKKQMEEQTRKHAAAEEAVKAARAPTFATPANPSTPSTPVPKSFRASLNSSLGTTPLSVPKFSFSPMTPSSGEVTKMRLKNAEKKQLEEQIRKREAAEEAAEAAV
ncbi:hypothetical protein EKO04_001909 [Ascochyta lentis]|uniref:J domain-containing protein n=1 Tax=Ascochyta lentis TaxID=205686 RepID=A0A8H7MMI4_9PLEO|nr:hypothetical protein EKO04_001909 [Ascochyta lentis]